MTSSPKPKDPSKVFLISEAVDDFPERTYKLSDLKLKVVPKRIYRKLPNKLVYTFQSGKKGPLPADPDTDSDGNDTYFYKFKRAKLDITSQDEKVGKGLMFVDKKGGGAVFLDESQMP